MFEAVNSVDRRYQPYGSPIAAPKDASKEAAAAAAAGEILLQLFPADANDLQAALSDYLKPIPDGPAKVVGIKIGEDVAANTIMDRKGDGADAPDAYRPKTKPGVYVPTPITASSMWPKVKPFAMTNPSQFGRSLRLRSPAPNGPPTTTRSSRWAASPVGTHRAPD